MKHDRWKVAAILLLFAIIVRMAVAAVSYSTDTLQARHLFMLQPGESLWILGSWTPVTFFASLSFLVSCLQAIFFYWQLSLISRGTEDTRLAAQAASKAADAAIAALDRPLIVIERAIHNKTTWVAEADSDLEAKFEIANYGKALAFISGIHAKLFLTMSPSNKIALANVELPVDYEDLPGAELLDFFMYNARPPVDSRGRPFSFDTPIIITPGERSPTFCVNRRDLIRKPVRVDVNAELLLVGRIWYHGPDEQPWVNSFCYFGGRDNQFFRAHGRPYNARNKAEGIF